MEQKLTVSPSPHISSNKTTRKIMADVIIALIPAGVFSAFIYGYRTLLVIATCIISAVISEYVSRRIMKRSNTLGDLSAIVTGLLLAYNLPPQIPLWIAALGSAIAIVVVKQFFGGIGQNFVNPAITARIVLLVSFPTAMTSWTASKLGNITTTATPLGMIAEKSADTLPSYFDLFFGLHGGCIGETSVLLLLIGGIYLVIRRVITPLIPTVYIGTVFVLSFLLGGDPLYQILSGGLMLGAIFMATDYTTSPLTNKGKVIFAVGCGVVTTLIRFYGSLPEGVSYSIMLMNVLVPIIDRFTAHKPFGAERRGKNEK